MINRQAIKGYKVDDRVKGSLYGEPYEGIIFSITYDCCTYFCYILHVAILGDIIHVNIDPGTFLPWASQTCEVI